MFDRVLTTILIAEEMFMVYLTIIAEVEPMKILSAEYQTSLEPTTSLNNSSNGKILYIYISL